MKYTYSGTGYLEGLPTVDLDDQDLTDEQQALLKRGIKAGLYTVASSTEKTEGEEKAHAKRDPHAQ